MSIASDAASPTKNRRPTTQRVVDVHSLHKSGTMFLFKFFRHLANQQNSILLSENHDPADDYLTLSLIHI